MEFIDDTSIISTETEDGIVLLNQRKGVYWHLNGTAAEILRSLREDGDRDVAVAEIRDRYGIDESRARNDVEDLIRSLESVGVLRR